MALPYSADCTCPICQQASTGKLAATYYETDHATFMALRARQQGNTWLVDYRATYKGRYPDFKEVKTSASMWLSVWNARANYWRGK